MRAAQATVATIAARIASVRMNNGSPSPPACSDAGNPRSEARSVRARPENGRRDQKQSHIPLRYQGRYARAGNTPVQHDYEQHIKYRVHYGATHRRNQGDAHFLQSAEDAVRCVYQQHVRGTQHNGACIGDRLVQNSTFPAQRLA